MKKIIFIVIMIIFLSLFFIIDNEKSEQRLYFLISRIFIYKDQNGFFPSEINEILNDNNNYTAESYCSFYDREIPGWGYCYYGYYDNSNSFYIEVRGMFHAFLYNSQRDLVDDGYKYGL